MPGGAAPPRSTWPVPRLALGAPGGLARPVKAPWARSNTGPGLARAACGSCRRSPEPTGGAALQQPSSSCPAAHRAHPRPCPCRSARMCWSGPSRMCISREMRCAGLRWGPGCWLGAAAPGGSCGRPLHLPCTRPAPACHCFPALPPPRCRSTCCTSSRCPCLRCAAAAAAAAAAAKPAPPGHCVLLCAHASYPASWLGPHLAAARRRPPLPRPCQVIGGIGAMDSIVTVDPDPQTDLKHVRAC